MSCQIEEFGRFVLVIWNSPEPSDVDRIIDAFKRSHEATGQMAIFIGRIPEGSTPPDDAMRKTFIANMDRLMEHCVALHAVIEGTGFVATIKRSAVSWITLATGKRKFFTVHARVTEIPAKVSMDVRADLSEAIRFFEAKGLIPKNASHFGFASA